MVVILKAEPNRDFPADTTEGSIRIEETAIEVGDFDEASRTCRAYIEQHGLGGGNWTGGQIWDDGVAVARVSYNGRVWPSPR